MERAKPNTETSRANAETGVEKRKEACRTQHAGPDEDMVRQLKLPTKDKKQRTV
jgi:hypothetical protein